MRIAGLVFYCQMFSGLAALVSLRGPRMAALVRASRRRWNVVPGNGTNVRMTVYSRFAEPSRSTLFEYRCRRMRVPLIYVTISPPPEQLKEYSDLGGLILPDGGAEMRLRKPATWSRPATKMQLASSLLTTNMARLVPEEDLPRRLDGRALNRRVFRGGQEWRQAATHF